MTTTKPQGVTGGRRGGETPHPKIVESVFRGEAEWWYPDLYQKLVKFWRVGVEVSTKPRRRLHKGS